MRAALDELNVGITAEHGVTLEVRIGIDTGDVVVSTLGDRPGQEFVVVGDIVNRASRFQSAAPRGGILISADTYRHVRGSFAVQPMTGSQLKGIDEPVDGYLVQSERPRGFRLDSARGVEGVDTRTVGRDTELRELQDRFHVVSEESQWQVVMVVGDAGIGKSRLLSEFDHWLDRLDEPVWWFRGGAAHAGQSLPYAVLHDLFADHQLVAGVVRLDVPWPLGAPLGPPAAPGHRRATHEGPGVAAMARRSADHRPPCRGVGGDP